MKAKYVFENLEFERGKDPKEALDIGILNRVKEEMQEMGYRYVNPDSILKWAAEFNKPNYIDLAMDIGASISEVGHHSIEIAAVAGNPEALEALLKHGAQPDWVSGYTYQKILSNNNIKTLEDPKIQDRYNRIREILENHPNFTPK